MIWIRVMGRNTKKRLSLVLVLTSFTLAAGSGCSTSPDAMTFEFHFDFRSGGEQGWTAGFADYPPGQEEFFELEAGYRSLPPPLNTSQNGLFSSGNNHSDDLFMFWKRGISLGPDTSYRVRFDVEFATNAPRGCVGVGGAPGEGVTIKAGSSVVEPEPVIVGNTLRMNIDIGNQTTGGADAIALGDFANSQICGSGPPTYELKTLSSATGQFGLTTDGSGAAWLIVGTDSGFEATTAIYWTRIGAVFEPM